MVHWKKAWELEEAARAKAKFERGQTQIALTLEQEASFDDLKTQRDRLQQATLDLAECVGASLQTGWTRLDAPVQPGKRCRYAEPVTAPK